MFFSVVISNKVRQNSWLTGREVIYTFHVSRMIQFKKSDAESSDVPLRRLIQCLREISKRADLQISETSLERLIIDNSSVMSHRSLRFSQGRLSVASETVILGLQIKAFFGYLFIYLQVFTFSAKLNWYRKLLRAWFKLEIYLQYLRKWVTFLDQMGCLHFS